MSDHEFTRPTSRNTRKQYLIRGGTPLRGTVRVSGSSRSAVILMAASLLCGEPVTLRNLPDTQEFRLFSAAISRLGCAVSYPDPDDRRTVLLRPDDSAAGLTGFEVEADADLPAVRLSYALLGVFLGRFGLASWSHFPFYGTLGLAPLTEHIRGFERMGAEAREADGRLFLTAKNGLKGCEISLETPSVGACINLMTAAVAAEGQTVIENAPDDDLLRELADFLNAMGADVRGAGTDRIEIFGGPLSRLHGTDFTLAPAAEEAGVYLCAAAAAGGDVTVEAIRPEQLTALTAVLEDMGVRLSTDAKNNSLRLVSRPPLLPFRAQAGPGSGIPLPLAPHLAACAAMARGVSFLSLSIGGSYAARLAEELSKLGVSASVSGEETQTLRICGAGKMTGAQVTPFVRQMVSGLTAAGLAAEGVTVVECPRGYEPVFDAFEEKLRSLGASLEVRQSAECR